VRPLSALRAPLAARLAERAAWVRGDHAVFVGLAPDAGPRLYEGFAEWDAGFVALRGGRLEYVGEEAAFTLAAADVRQVRLDQGWPGWIRLRAVRVRWERPDGSRGVFGLVALGGADTLAARRDTRRLLETLDRWREGEPPVAAEDAAPGEVPLGPPPTAGVTSDSPREAAAPRGIVGAWVLLGLFSVLAAGLAGLPFHPLVPGWLDAAAATLLGHLLTIAPVLGWREPEGDDDAPSHEERRAA
jgi:hypothetical protein